MATFVILSRISPQAFDDPKNFKDMAKTVSEKIKRQCPGVTWKESFATLGRFDIVDIVEAADPKEVEKAAMLIAPTGMHPRRRSWQPRLAIGAYHGQERRIRQCRKTQSRKHRQRPRPSRTRTLKKRSAVARMNSMRSAAARTATTSKTGSAPKRK